MEKIVIAGVLIILTFLLAYVCYPKWYLGCVDDGYLPAIAVILWYLISCVMDWAFDKFRKKVLKVGKDE